MLNKKQREQMNSLQIRAEKQRFSIRKLSIGAASVLLGLTFLGVNSQTASAATNNDVQAADDTNQTTDLDTYSGLKKFLKSDSETNTPAETTQVNTAADDDTATKPQMPEDSVETSESTTNVSEATTPTSNDVTTLTANDDQATAPAQLENLGKNGDCDILWDASSKTLHVKASTDGNQLANKLVTGLNSDIYNKITHIMIDDPVAFPEDSSFMFSNYYSGLDQLEDISGLNKVDTSHVTNMSCMFYYDKSLISLDLSSFDTGKVISFDQMFNGCIRLKKLDISNFDTHQVVNMSSMFSYCTNLVDLNLGRFDTSSAIYISGMFGSCWSLASLDLSNFDTSMAQYFSYMFSGLGSKYKFVFTLPAHHFDKNAYFDYNGINIQAVDAAHGGTIDHPVGTKYTTDELADLYASANPPAETYVMVGAHDNERYLASAKPGTLVATAGQDLVATSDQYLQFTDQADNSIKTVSDLKQTYDLINNDHNAVIDVAWSGNGIDETGHLTATTGTVNATATVTFGDGTMAQVPVALSVSQAIDPNANYQVTAATDGVLQLHATDVGDVTVAKQPEFYDPDVINQLVSVTADGTSVNASSVIDHLEWVNNGEPSTDYLSVSNHNPDLYDQGTVRAVFKNGKKSRAFKIKVNVVGVTLKDDVNVAFNSSLTPISATDHVANGANYLDLSQIDQYPVAYYTWSDESDQDTSVEVNYGKTGATKTVYLMVHYQDGTEQAVPITVTIKSQATINQYTQTAPLTAHVVNVNNGATASLSQVTDQNQWSNFLAGDLSAIASLTWADPAAFSQALASRGEQQAELVIKFKDESTQTMTVNLQVTALNAQVDQQKTFDLSQTTIDHTQNDPTAAAYLDLSAEDQQNIIGYTWSGDAQGTSDLELAGAGSQLAYLIVHYQDGTAQAVAMPVMVKPQSLQWQFQQTQTVSVPLNSTTAPAAFADPSSFLTNTETIAKINWVTAPDTSVSGDMTAAIQLTFKDGSTLIHLIKINVA
ncbi:BspA family leucine-rich repeat surface protein [Lactobacillus sp. ESL0681]|uniref:BspA family leucine-rich repeat surface protein n=1 Tax=Lactobacillus sp. ESL0681 TaxID=2983211 RepID=UPI0023F86557|nr:BspA family leucine-rich repeat surface protein [Lactobacillus sp. ESL0681]WEV40107.1 BspA family leucine-rich repeat surface protein [Lactobacillus sp. ESL0681]